VIDFLGAGTVHNYFTQGTGNNMQINTNVDESNVIGDATRSQWKLVLGSSLDWFSIRRSPAGGTYDEDALFFIEGSTGRVGIATVDTGNLAAIPFTFQGRLHVETDSGNAVYGRTASTSGRALYGHATATTGSPTGVYGRSDSTSGIAVLGYASPSTGPTYGVVGQTESASGTAVYGRAFATSGTTYGVYGHSNSASGTGVYGYASATIGGTYGVYGQSDSASGTGVYGAATDTTGLTSGLFGWSRSTSGRGVNGYASADAGDTCGVYGQADSTSGQGVYGRATATTGSTHGVFGQSESTSGHGVMGWANATTGAALGVWGQSDSTSGRGVYGGASADTGTNYGVYGWTNSPSGYGVYSNGDMHAVGDFTATGTKAAIVQTRDFGWRHLYAMESPQTWFEDFGQASLASGEAVVSIEPIFAQTVNLDRPYHVFLTPLGDCGLYVAEQTATSFTVRALNGSACDVAFHYRLVAARLGYEDLRLEPAEDPEAEAASIPAME
jgi:hypothetical protein